MAKAVRWKVWMLLGLLVIGLATAGYKLQNDAPAISDALYWGSSGQDVKNLQWRLQQWGYYNGPIDGDFGQDTYTAVQKFQANNGLASDGVAGQGTLTALGLWTAQAAQAPEANQGSAVSRGIDRRGDVTLLAHVIHSEAGGEPYEGQVAVGAVIMNRTSSALFPSTMAGVIYQPNAFESVTNGLVNQAPDSTALRAAQDAINGYDPTYGCLFFWNPAKPVSAWIWSRAIVTQIGNHVFAR